MAVFARAMLGVQYLICSPLFISLTGVGLGEAARLTASDGPEAVDLVCAVQCIDTALVGDRRRSNDALFVSTVTVTAVLQGDSAMHGRTLRTEEHTAFQGPAAVRFGMRKRSFYIVILRPDGVKYIPHVVGSCAITSAPIHLPDEASLDERINIILIESLRAWRNDIRSSLIIRALARRANNDSPYYSLLRELLALEGSSNSYVRMFAVRARLELNDPSAMAAALKLAGEEEMMQPWIPPALERFGEDGVTTLCLIAEGRYLPIGKVRAVESLRHLASPRSLPTLIKILDDPTPDLQYYAFSAIEKIRFGDMITMGNDFYGGPGDSSGQRPTAHSQARVEEVKKWWREEGQKQFDYVEKTP